MQRSEIRFTVFFEDPFWVGVYERIYDGKLEVCKITFGPEPKDYQIYAFLMENWEKLKFSPRVKTDETYKPKINPKRMQRNIKKHLKMQGVGTKSQQALKLQQEENKVLGKEKRRNRKEERKQRQFELRQEKKKAKHRGK